MLRGIGMSVLLSWICLNAFGQLPHPNDTLDNGAKVPFKQFLGRFSFYSEGFGSGLVYSLNVGYNLLNTELVTLDYTIGGSRLPMASGTPFKPQPEDYYKLTSGVRLFVGRRKSRLTITAGYAGSLQTGWFSGNTNYPSCGFVCAGPTQHMFTFSLGYTYQHHYGVFFGVHAYGLVQLTPRDQRWLGAPNEDILPWPGVTLGYRVPSRQLRKEWKERGFKRRILRLEEPKAKKEKKPKEEEEDWFDDTGELQVDSVEMAEIEERLAKLRKRQLRYQLQEQPENGRSHVFVEGFGAAGFWSVNYSYTYPFAKTDLVALDFRGGVGTDDIHLQIPIHAGVKIMKNYRGTGVYLGVQPTIDWRRGTAGAIYFLEHNVEFHFAYGLTGGVSFYLFYDPSSYKHRSDFSPYGGFFLGYRLPRLKKNP